MKSFLDLLRQIAEHGTPKHPTREGVGPTKNATIGLPNLQWRHDLAAGFPLLTTRRISFAKQTVGELRTFLEGGTNVADFRRNGCTFWDPWGGENGDLGPIYGAQWRARGQLYHVLRCLRERPTDRRMVVSAWRPDEHARMALPPCHVMWVVTPYDGKLNLHWTQRSCDFPIGVPYNIASYALLAHLLAAWAGMEPGEISATFCDAHIYENQREGVDEWLDREPGALPTVDCDFTDDRDFWSWRVDLRSYHPHAGRIDLGEVEV